MRVRVRNRLYILTSACSVYLVGARSPEAAVGKVDRGGRSCPPPVLVRPATSADLERVAGAGGRVSKRARRLVEREEGAADGRTVG